MQALNPADNRAAWRLLALIVAGALAISWAGNWSAPFWDRDEPRFADAARTMIRTGDVVTPHFNMPADCPPERRNEYIRYDKPILGYYGMAAGMLLLGQNEFGARAASAVYGAASIILLFLLARRMFRDNRKALMAAAMLATAPVMVVESKLCTVDALLLLTIIAAFYALWRIYEGPCGAGWKALFWAALGASILTKYVIGPAAVGGAIVLMAVVSRDRSWLRRMGWWWGAPLAVVIVAPWALAVQRATGGEFLPMSLGKHVVTRGETTLEGHSGFPGFYIVTMFATFFPWAFFVPGSVWNAVKGLRDRKREIFMLAWAAALLVALEVARTKMVHYSLPIFPALALLVVNFFDDAPRRKGLFLVGMGFAVAMALAMTIAAPYAMMRAGLENAAMPFIAGGVLLLAGLALWAAAFARTGRALVWMPVVTMYAWLFIVAAWIAPAIGQYCPSRPVGAIVRAQLRNDGPGARAALIGYQEPSLVFYCGGGVEIVRRAPQTPAELKAAGGPRVYTAPVDSGAAALLSANGEKRGEVKGFNFGNGKWVTIGVYDVK